jgi:hypothetical protein
VGTFVAAKVVKESSAFVETVRRIHRIVPLNIILSQINPVMALHSIEGFILMSFYTSAVLLSHMCVVHTKTSSVFFDISGLLCAPPILSSLI